MKAGCSNVFCLDRLSLLLQIWVLGRGWRGLSSLGRNGCGSCSGFRVPGNCVIVGCPFYRRLLLIGLLCLSLSALGKNDTGPDQEQERRYFWYWARWGSTGDRTCSLLFHLLSSIAFQTMKSSVWEEVCVCRYRHSLQGWGLQSRLQCLVLHWMGLGSVWVG